jgi:iron complex outermembrane receptor protein
LAWDVALYRAELKHELLTFTIDPDHPAATFNADKTLHQGIEAGWTGGSRRVWRLRQTYAWSDFHFEGDAQYGDNALPVVPEHLYRAELKYEHPAGWFVAPSVEWSPRGPFVDYRNKVRAPGLRHRLLGAGYMRGGVTLFLDARNLFDKRYVNTVNPLANPASVPAATIENTAAFWPGEGRGLFAGVSGKF